ncbi:MAG: polymerase sigma factor SigW [Verrucomicrobiota bacterium]
MDDSAIINLFVSHRDRLWTMAHLILRDHQLAEDAMQETLAELLRGSANYDDSRPLLNWAIGVTRFKAMQILRKHHRLSLFDEREIAEIEGELVVSSHSDADRDDEEQRTAALRHCLELLSESNRKLLLNKYEGKQSARQLSAARRCSETAIFSLLQRLRIQVHRCVTQQLQGG